MSVRIYDSNEQRWTRLAGHQAMQGGTMHIIKPNDSIFCHGASYPIGSEYHAITVSAPGVPIKKYFYRCDDPVSSGMVGTVNSEGRFCGTVSSGGSVTISSGGKFDGMLVEYGTVIASSGGIVVGSATVVEQGGLLHVLSGGSLVCSGIINARCSVFAGGSVVVNNRGSLICQFRNSINGDVAVKSGGYFQGGVVDPGTIVISAGGRAATGNYDSWNGSCAIFGSLAVSGAWVDHFDTVYWGAGVYGGTVYAGGSVFVGASMERPTGSAGGGTFSGTVNSGGIIQIDAGGSFYGDLKSGGKVICARRSDIYATIESGGIIEIK